MARDTLTVALSTSSFLPAQGGAEIGLHNIALQLMAKGHRPVVITSAAHKWALRRRGWKLPYELVAYPPRLLTWREIRPRLARVLLNWFHAILQRRYGFDVWHATFGFPTGVSVIEFCRSRGIAHLVRCVGADIQVRHDIGYGMRLNPVVDADIRHWLPEAQCLVAITESVVEEYRDIGIGDERIARIPNGIDLARFRAHRSTSDLRARFGIAEDVRVFLALGRNHPKKNFAQLIDAGVTLKSRQTAPFAIVIAGKGVAELARHVRSAGAEGLVHLVEPDDEPKQDGALHFPADSILDLYFAADVFVMPSLIETFGIVIIEAMAAGLPVIAADSPGCRDVVDGGRFGRLYDGSTEALTTAMNEILERADLRKALAAKSQARAVEFDWSRIVDQYLQKYRQLIAEPETCVSAKHAPVRA